jgi:glycosyltransferase involved in cell wall biosynthesis
MSVGGGRHRPGCDLLVVSHPCVLAVNQSVYLALQERGWRLTLAVPNRWRHEYAESAFTPEPLPGLEGSLMPLPVLLPGRVQRHAYLASTGRILRSVAPRILFVEQESFYVPALQWGFAAQRARIPFGFQADENLDRPLPWPARMIRTQMLGRASFVAARSPTAGELVRRWGTQALVSLVPHAVPRWASVDRSPRAMFTIGFAGRLVEEKGIWDLIAACRRLGGPVRLLVVGDGPLRSALADVALFGEVRICSGLPHERMPDAYAEMDVLVLPSRTTTTWAEQFGRVLVEALWCGVPVIGSDSGEIPWVIGETGGGRLFPEGNQQALAAVLQELRDDPEERRLLAGRGRAAVDRMFSVDACADALHETLIAVTERSRQPVESRGG